MMMLKIKINFNFPDLKLLVKHHHKYTIENQEALKKLLAMTISGFILILNKNSKINDVINQLQSEGVRLIMKMIWAQ